MTNYQTPKAKFIADVERLRLHRQLVTNPHVQASLDAALQQMQLELQFSKVQPADAFHHLSGAILFMQTWLDMAEERDVKPLIQPQDNLNPHGYPKSKHSRA